MSSICFDGVALAQRLVEEHGDAELGGNILASARQCESRPDCPFAGRCSDTLTKIDILLAQRQKR